MICEKCGTEHNGSYGSKRFCSASCARSFSSNICTNLYKTISCNSCGNEMIVKRRSSSNRLCNECKKKTKIKVCKVCGSEYFAGIKGCRCTNQFCSHHGIQQFEALIKYFGFDETKLGTPEVETEFYRIREMLSNLYWNEHKSSKEISEMFGYPDQSNLIDKIFKRYMNIPIKSLSYSFSESFSEGRRNMPSVCYNYVSGWHKTWNGKYVYLRSSYEFDYAEELDKQMIDYEVELLRIRYLESISGEIRCAIPDFYLPETNTIVEIKSNWTLDLQNMKDKKKSYIENGYNFKLICEHKELEL